MEAWRLLWNVLNYVLESIDPARKSQYTLFEFFTRILDSLCGDGCGAGVDSDNKGYFYGGSSNNSGAHVSNRGGGGSGGKAVWYYDGGDTAYGILPMYASTSNVETYNTPPSAFWGGSIGPGVAYEKGGVQYNAMGFMVGEVGMERPLIGEEMLIPGGGLVGGIVKSATGGFANKLFLSETFGITSKKFANSITGVQGTWNQQGKMFKIGWSSVAENGGGMQLSVLR